METSASSHLPSFWFRKSFPFPCCVWLKTLPCTLQGENGYFHQAVDEYGVCQGASSFWRSSSHSLTHPIYIYTPILLEFSSPLFLYYSPGSFRTCSIVVVDSIANDPPSSSYPLSLTVFLSPTVRRRRHELKVAIWSGQGLQHRTWVMPLPTARVLCCSQWSCLSSPPLLSNFWFQWLKGNKVGCLLI